jgi:GNAT superfamily N-acetyltransferase
MSAESPITVRAATRGDAEAIADINLKARYLAYPGIMADRYLDELEKEKAGAAEGRRDRITRPYGPRTFELVAEHEEEVVGWLRAGPKRDDDRHETQGEIWSGYVPPDAWRSGVGSALMTAALERLAIEGYTQATRWVFEEKARARLFYERLGWSVDGATALFERGGGQAIEIRCYRPL